MLVICTTRPQLTTILLWFCVGAVSASTLGCGSAKPDIWPVAGTVLFNDKPITAGYVAFYPEDLAAAGVERPASVAPIKEDGTYELAGVPPGRYKVTVDVKRPRKQRANPQLMRPYSQKYTKMETTDLTVEVVKDPPPGHYDLPLTQ
jgi:hypothetical protein